MIVTVTPNTSIDKAYQLDSPLAVGKVQRAVTYTNTAGGKGLNAARAVKAAGADILASGFVGGHNGAYLESLLDADNIAHDFVRANIETRSCINILDSNLVSTEVLEGGCEVNAQDAEKLTAKVAELAKKADVITFNGSLPKGMAKDAYVPLIEAVKAAGKPCILDTSGESLLAGAKALPTVMKPNEDELAQLTGEATEDEEAILSAAQKLHKSGVDTVIISLGAKGAVMVCHEGVFKGIPPAIQVVNPVGAGDTVVGVFAAAMARGVSRKESLKMALASATANCLTPKTGSFDPETAREIAQKTEVVSL